MQNLIFKTLKFIFIFLPLVLINFNDVKALPIKPVKDIKYPNTIKSQIPAVSQLSNIGLNSWEFQALESLNNRYQCLEKNDNTLENFSTVIIRSSFANLLAQCLANIEQKSNLLDNQDILTIRRLQQEFEPLLLRRQTQIKKLETQISQLEKQSIVSKIQYEGEAIIAVVGVGQNDTESSLALGSRVRLDFITSLTEKDELQVRLQGRNIPELEEITNTKMANLGFDGDDDNEVEIDEIEYEVFLTENTTLGLFALGGGVGDLIPTINPLFSGSGDGSISTFGRENPIRRQAEGTAFSISQDFGKNLNFTTGYVSNNANEIEQGLINSAYAIITQLTFEADQKLGLSLTYGYTNNNIATGTGSALAENPFGNSDQIRGHSYGAEISLWLQPNINFGGRIGWIQAYAKDLYNSPKVDIFTWAIMLGITNLGSEDSLLGFLFGQPPKVIQNSLGKEFEDPDTAYHIELFYRWQLTDDIAMTPGFFWIIHPEHSRDRDPILVGTIRTTFEF